MKYAKQQSGASQLQAAKRDRSVILDTWKVKNIAEQLGYKNLATFEREFNRFSGVHADINTTAPRNAWYGRKLDKNKATAIAVFLGFNSYEALLPEDCTEWIFPAALTWDADYSPPGALLKAEYSIVPFHQREAEMQDLLAWCEADNKLAVRLYTGVGGMGKTRLAIELCRVVQHNLQWQTGFLRQRQASYYELERFACLQNKANPVLIIVDYAETRRLELTLLLQAALHADSKIRIILLARSALDWWVQLRTANQGVGDLLMSRATQVIALQALGTTAKHREESFFLAADSFTKQLKAPPLLSLPQDLDAAYFDRVLLLHMQALISVEGKATTTGLKGILDVILNRERHFWESHAKAVHLPVSLYKAIGIAIARITLLGGVKSREEVMEVLDYIPLLKDSRWHEKQLIIDLLHNLYPSSQTGKNANAQTYYIEPLQPDLLGEYLIQQYIQAEIPLWDNFT